MLARCGPELSVSIFFYVCFCPARRILHVTLCILHAPPCFAHAPPCIAHALPSQALFTGHCPKAHHAVSRLGDIATYHAHCCGRHDDKLLLLARVVEAAAIGGANLTFKRVRPVKQ